MSLGKRLLAKDEGVARTMYSFMVINGAQYCRRNLRTHCHLCQVDYRSLNDEIDEERRRLHLRPSGDRKLNEESEKWADLVLEHTI